ncbi:MAG TPA: hypothetical protein VEI07_27285 [Planctomycetaceae bacterium]|nr:hypothetical protein [Planctomycetaceae bacterium]
MFRKPMVLALHSVAFGTLALLFAQLALAKDPEVKDGIPGTVAKVDAANGKLTITDKENRERTYSITEETVMVGPRGGVVHRRLKDHRFHAGLPITVVADGNTAVELHLGYDRKAKEGAAETPTPTRSRTFRSPNPPSETPTTNDAGSSTPSTTPTPSIPTTRTSRFRGPTQPKEVTQKDTAKDEDEEDDVEFPGKVKSVEPARHNLVITLVNGNDRSFLVSSEVKVLVNGRETRHGLSDAAFKPGVRLTVVTEPGGRKVKEVKVNTAAIRRQRKAA